MIQGADILTTSDRDHLYQVFMPDFFEGEPCNSAWYVYLNFIPVFASLFIRLIIWGSRRYPPETEDQKKNIYAWFETRTPAISAERTPRLIKDIEELYGKKTWGAVGVFPPRLLSWTSFI